MSTPKYETGVTYHTTITAGGRYSVSEKKKTGKGNGKKETNLGNKVTRKKSDKTGNKYTGKKSQI